MKKRAGGRTRMLARLLAVAVLGLVALPARSLADADPASDFLLTEAVFYPYQPPTSPALQRTLTRTLAHLKARGVALKVAIVGTAQDLGAVTNLFGTPQRYADFLDREISFNTHQALLVVMPAGYGTVNAGPSTALAGVPVDGQHGSDGLARSAIGAVVRLASAMGRPIPAPAIPASSTHSSGSGLTWIAFVVPVLAVLAAALLNAGVQRRRRRGAPEPGDPAPPGD